MWPGILATKCNGSGLAYHNLGMRIFTAFAVLTLTTSLYAQVYRCGSTYSNSPCAGGKTVEVAPSVSMVGGTTNTTTLYLCQSYGGGQFWSLQHCVKHGALVDRIESIPAHLPFDQQVEMASGQRNRAVALAAPPVQASRVDNVAPGKSIECAALDERIHYLDQLGRTGGNAQYMDWIANERKQARDRQFGLRC